MPSIFSRIINGEIPGHFVWQDDTAVAIMTIEPIHEGHLLVIPRDEIDHWDDLDPEVAAHLMKVSQQLAKALKKAFPAKRVGMMIAGLEVPHTHIHVLPINAISELNFALARPASQEQLASAAQRIRDCLANA